MPRKATRKGRQKPSDEPSGGVKYDTGKPEYDLIPAAALDAMVVILTIGAQKYAAENWRKVPNGKRRYFAALQRHLWAWKRGQKFDPETGQHHLAHAACNLFFLHELDIGLGEGPNSPTNHEAK